MVKRELEAATFASERGLAKAMSRPELDHRVAYLRERRVESRQRLLSRLARRGQPGFLLPSPPSWPIWPEAFGAFPGSCTGGVAGQEPKVDVPRYVWDNGIRLYSEDAIGAQGHAPNL